MTGIRCALCVLFLLPIPADHACRADVAPGVPREISGDLQELLQIKVNLLAQLAEINAQRDRELQPLEKQKQLQVAIGRAYHSDSPMNDDSITRLDEQIAEKSARLAELCAQLAEIEPQLQAVYTDWDEENYERLQGELSRKRSAINSLETGILDQDEQRKAGVVEDRDLRRKRRSDAYRERKRINTEINRIRGVYSDRRKSVAKDYIAINNALKVVMIQYFNKVTINGTVYEVRDIRGDSDDRYFSVSWSSGGREPDIDAAIYIDGVLRYRDIPVKPPQTSPLRLTKHTNNEYHLRNAYVYVAFDVRKAEWQSRQWLAANAGRFVDLEGLAQLRFNIHQPNLP